MRAGKISPKAVSDILYSTWVKAYENSLTASATSVTISGLTGDTDKEYKLEARIVNGYDGSTGIFVQPNGDSGNNYGYQYLQGANTTADAGRNTITGFIFAYPNGLSKISQSSLIISAKSGYVRTAIQEEARTISTTTVTNLFLMGQSWNNTADEITSLVVLADQTGGIASGSSINLWKRAYKS